MSSHNKKHNSDLSPSQQYDLEHFSREEDIQFYLELANKIVPNRVLDIGCGTGRISIPLVRASWKVTGVDKAEVMLEGLEQKITSLPKDLKNNIEVFRLEMQKVDSLDAKYDLIIVSFNTFHNLRLKEEQVNFLHRVGGLLTHKGMLVIDISTPSHGNLRDSKKWKLEKTNENEIYRSERYYRHKDHDMENKVISIEFLTKLYNRAGMLIDYWSHNYRSTYHDPAEIDQLVENCGYKIAAKYGDYYFDDFSRVDDPEEQILLLRKQ